MTDTTGMMKPLRLLCFFVSASLLALPATDAIAQPDAALSMVDTAALAMVDTEAADTGTPDTGTADTEAADTETTDRETADTGVGESTELRPDRLWLPANRRNLQPLLVAAAQRALENPECADVLYGRLNEYRTQRTEPTFSILCMHDARTTFNLLYLASELEAEENARSADSGQPLNPELERLRDLLQEPVVPSTGASGQATPSTANESPHIPVPAVTTPPEIF